MRVGLSEYLTTQIDLMKKLVNKLKLHFDYVSILGTDVVSKDYYIKRTGTEVKDTIFNERGFVVRVYNGHNYSEHSFNVLTEEQVDLIGEDIISVGKGKANMLAINSLQLREYPKLNEEPIIRSYFSEVEIHPNSITSREKIEIMNKIMEKGLQLSDELVDMRIKYEETQVSKVFISNNKELVQSYIWTNAFIIPIARREGDVKYTINSISGLKGAEILKELEGHLEEGVNHTLALLEGERIVPGEYDIICDPDVAGLIAHEAFGHGVEMDMFVKDRAKAAEYMNKQVASDMVIMKDGALSAQEVSSYFFDDEGTLGTDTVIIENGILKSGISDVLSAVQTQTVPTGNGKRESFERKAYARMTNTIFDSGQDDLEDMIASIKHGYLLEGYLSGMEDPKNWGIQCVIISGREIIDGKLTGKIVTPVYLTGYVPDLLKSITMMSKEVVTNGAGYCGKGHKERVKTSGGGPYIKARGRLS